MTETVRLRFAPSPTGTLHIGGARTALFNWAFARRHGGAFLLRIEDTDLERSKREYEDGILAGLRWLGLEWDEGPDIGGPHGPYRQVERQAEHLEIADKLLADGHAYRCFCTADELAVMREEAERTKKHGAFRSPFRDLAPGEARKRADGGDPFVVRFKVPEGTTRVTDIVRGKVSFPHADVDDWVMVRADRTPTYNLVVVCDDAHMRISHVCRGEEHLTNTPKQVLLCEALGLEIPRFAHLPLMLGSDKKKLSKRTGDTALADYQAQGYPPEAVLNFLSLQGWALDGSTEVFSVDDLIANFDLADVSKGGSIFDTDKFQWLAGEYVRADDPARLAERCLPWVESSGIATEADLRGRWDWYVRAVALEQERFRLYSELPPRIAYLFVDDGEVLWDAKAEKNSRKHEDAAKNLAAFGEWLRPKIEGGVDAAALRDGAKAWVGEQGLKFPQLFQPLRCALTGAAGGADLFDVIELLGPERTLRRIAAGVERLGG